MRINVFDWNVVKTIIKSKCLLIVDESMQTVLLIWSVLHHHNAIDENNIKHYMYTQCLTFTTSTTVHPSQKT